MRKIATIFKPKYVFFGLTGTILAKELFKMSYAEENKILSEKKEEIFCPKVEKKFSAGQRKDGLKEYTEDDVSQHNTIEKGIWVTFKEGVYDITNFVNIHPGGEKILLASGGPVDPFWELYASHLNPDTFELIEKYRIGNLKITKEKKQISTDPYANEPKRLNIFRVNAQKPFNAEPSLNLLIQNFITPNDIHYVRNHLPVPVVEMSDYKIDVEGLGVNKTRITLEDLKTKFHQVKVVASIQCAGNRRSEMNLVKPVKGLDWSGGAIGNAEWTGVRLRDILLYSGIHAKEGIKHVHFEGLDKDPTGVPYGASIPFVKAFSEEGDVIVAYEMNGKEIPRDHGFPVRVIVPGVVGARNVKWLSKIITSNEESKSFWQQNDYKGFSPSVDFSNADYKTSPAIQELPVQSQICEPLNNSIVKSSDETINVKGYSWSGGGRGIAWVDVSIDGGKSWKVARIKRPIEQEKGRVWAWSPWEIELEIPKDQKEIELIAKAVDDSYNVQPDTIAPEWNIRGVLTNSWSKIKVKVE